MQEELLPSWSLSPLQVLDPPLCVLGPGGPLLPVGPIVDVLQYSQKDLDAVVRTGRRGGWFPRVLPPPVGYGPGCGVHGLLQRPIES